MNQKIGIGIGIGISEFRQLRQAGLLFVDKSFLVGEVHDTAAQVILLPRPRRFGKTLNLSMLRYFFERCDELMDFMRGLLSVAFKDNPHVYKCVATGILRVAKESIFSGLNNLDVHGILSDRFNHVFGFKMHIALADLGLDRFWVVYPGTEACELGRRMAVLPLRRIPDLARDIVDSCG